MQYSDHLLNIKSISVLFASSLNTYCCDYLESFLNLQLIIKSITNNNRPTNTNNNSPQAPKIDSFDES